MQAYLEKKNRTTTDFVLLEADDKFIKKSTGKVGKSGIAYSTLNAGSVEKAFFQVQDEVMKYLAKGFVEASIPSDLQKKDMVFDKAKWHINDDFPKELDHYQSYVHSGMFICWLIENNQFEQAFKQDHARGIELLTTRQITPSKFYEEYLDGVFDAEGWTQEAIKFTLEYFDFDKGQYISDYLRVFDPNDIFPTVFHVADTWENYEKLKGVIDAQYSIWKQNTK